jgi:P2 family phage major capsid protein
MRNATRATYNNYLRRIAELNGVPDASVQFSIEPSIQQTLENQIQLSSAFLQRINMIGVVEMEGEKLKLGTTSTIASRTDTTKKDRTPAVVHGLDNQRYRCEKTNFDTAIKYAQLDAWAKFQDFQTRVRDVIVRQQALDRIMIGWNGVKVAPDTDRATYPLLQDVNIGWLQHIRADAPAHWMKEGAAGSGKVQVGAGKDYATLDALVFDVTEELIDEPFRDNPDLVVVCGRGLLHDKYFKLINQDQTAQNQLASDIIISQKQIGGLPAVRVPFFPPGALLVTTLDNLSIYYQDGSRRRQVKDKPERDQIENYESSNDAYVVENYGATALVENIVLG